MSSDFCQCNEGMTNVYRRAWRSACSGILRVGDAGGIIHAYGQKSLRDQFEITHESGSLGISTLLLRSSTLGG